MHKKDGAVENRSSIRYRRSVVTIFFSSKKIAFLSVISLIFLIFIPVITFGGTLDLFNSFDDNNEEEIDIINIQSYPIVNGKWVVKFTTKGNANLEVFAINNTKWSNVNNKYDLRFLHLKNNGEILEYEWIDNHVFVENYSSDSTGYFVSKVFTDGKHTLKFSYGDDTDFAYNDAAAFTYLKNDTITQVFGPQNKTMTNVSYDLSINALKLNNTKVSGNYISRAFDGGSVTNWSNFQFNLSYNNRTCDVLGYMWDQDGNESIVFYKNLTYALDTYVDNSDNEIDFKDKSANWSLPSNATVENITGMCFDSGNNDAYLFLKNGSYVVDRNYDPTDSPEDISFTDDHGSYTVLPGYTTNDILGYVFDDDGDEMLVFYNDGNYSGDEEVLSADLSINFTAYNGNFSLPVGYTYSNVLGFNFMEDADDVVVFFDNNSFFKNQSFSPFIDPPWKDINFTDFNGNALYQENVTLVNISTNILFQVRSDDDNSSWGEFIGPDGTNSTYYSKPNGQKINVAANRYFQYKAYFSTTNDTITAYLYNVTIRYNNNQKPITRLISPSPNGTSGISLNPKCRIEVNDTDGDNLTVYWYENTTGSFVLRNTNNSVSANITVFYSFSEFSDYNTTYHWSVRIYDGEFWNNKTYFFTTENEPNIAPNINSYDLKNGTGSKLNNQTGSIDNNNEYYFEINITDENGWQDIDYINITSWFDNGDDTSEYNDTKGSNLNMFLQYKNTSGTKDFNLIWPDDEVDIVTNNCSETIINSTTRIIRIAFISKNQVRWGGGDGNWDLTKNITNDLSSWNFNISVEDSSKKKCYKKDEYGVSRYTYIKKGSKFLYVNVIAGDTAETNVVSFEYSANYNYTLSLYFETNLTNSSIGTEIPVEDNIYILEKADSNDDITVDIKFNGTGCENKIEILNNSGIFQSENNTQTVLIQFQLGVPIGTYSGKYNSRMATELVQKQ